MKITIQEECNLQDGGEDLQTKVSGDTNKQNVKDNNCYYPYWNQSAWADQKMSKLKTQDHSEYCKRIPILHLLKNSVNNIIFCQ